MVAIAHLAGAFVLFALLTHIATTLIAMRRLRVPQARAADRRRATGHDHPSGLRRRCPRGADPPLDVRARLSAATRSCSAAPRRTTRWCRWSERLIAEHPAVKARLLIGDDHPSPNPEAQQRREGLARAAHEWIVIADSNVACRATTCSACCRNGAPTRALSARRPSARPERIWAELECAYLNTYQARWQYAAGALGSGFAQGKNMLWRRSDLEGAGGILALAREPAEDAAATKVVRGLGLRVRLADGAFPQPLGPRTAGQVWRRQVRWARLRRATFPGSSRSNPLRPGGAAAASCLRDGCTSSTLDVLGGCRHLRAFGLPPRLGSPPPSAGI